MEAHHPPFRIEDSKAGSPISVPRLPNRAWVDQIVSIAVKRPVAELRLARSPIHGTEGVASPESCRKMSADEAARAEARAHRATSPDIRLHRWVSRARTAYWAHRRSEWDPAGVA